MKFAAGSNKARLHMLDMIPTEVETVPDGFKQTEIGLIPEEWSVVQLGDPNVARLIMGQSPTSDTYNTAGDGLPFFQGKADFGSKYPTPSKWCSSPIRIAEPKDVLMSVRAPVGDVNLASAKSCIGRGLAAIRASIASDHEFLFYLLTHEKERIEQQGSGTTFKSINKDVLKVLPISLPPLPEQRAIAHVLSKIQAAAETQAKIAERARELKRALMAKLFTEGLRGERLKETEIGLMPEGWEVAPLGDCVTQAQYGLSVRGEESGKYPILRMTNQQNGDIVPANLQHVNISENELAKFKINRGELLFNRTNSMELVGRTAIFDLEEDYVFASYLIRVAVIREKLEPHFLNFYLNDENSQARLKGLATRGVSQSNISASRLRTFIIPVPPLDEQRKIARILQTVDAKITSAERKRAGLEELFRAMLGQLMTGRVRANSFD